MDFEPLEVGQGRKGYCGRKATKVRCNKAKSTSAVVLQRVRCGRKAKVGSVCKGGVQSQRVRSDRKSFPGVGSKRKRTSRNPS